MAREYDLAHTRNIGIMAHIDAGLLYWQNPQNWRNPRR